MVADETSKDGALWLAVHTKPRQERTAEEHLTRQGFECFFPRAFNVQRRLKREKPRIEALFPRYLFIRAAIGVQDLSPVRSTRGVSRVVRFGTQLARVPDWVIRSLHSMMDGETGLIQLAPPRLERGNVVEVLDGPLAGLKAIFQQMDGKHRAVLLMSLLGREQRVTVPSAELRIAG